jgi:hypothetical protein
MNDNPVIWNKCSHEVYRAVYNEFKDRLGVYAVAGDYGSTTMTTWALGDAPLIKSEGLKVNGKGEPDSDGHTSGAAKDWTYYIATARYLEAA